eukprot:CAMPEP_0197323150 /NCGR_PEP_ID=MMETSP0891-20130614/70336_1 /TAXON_ID=44058 ORGANISM="Aureoumbra lagunensis, Strain CCMP1510" /NCGR_SAMPLE_ID=MMETSP0891 /ASSEMBLY_ACC=CAM_ASM_000534 /LENGTH=129 /DNA_ID=CAMNT_0042815715 /DNA_START=181 /DNA_END=570 /DNA_ORIENTATION=+
MKKDNSIQKKNEFFEMTKKLRDSLISIQDHELRASILEQTDDLYKKFLEVAPFKSHQPQLPPITANMISQLVDTSTSSHDTIAELEQTSNTAVIQATLCEEDEMMAIEDNNDEDNSCPREEKRRKRKTL